MKKVMLAAAAVLVLGLVGCSKTKDCNCKVEAMGMTLTTFELLDQDDCGSPKDIPAEVQATMQAAGGKITCTEK